MFLSLLCVLLLSISFSPPPLPLSPPFPSLPSPLSLTYAALKIFHTRSYQGDQHYDSNELFGDTIIRQANDAEKRQNLERLGYLFFFVFFFRFCLFLYY